MEEESPDGIEVSEDGVELLGWVGLQAVMSMPALTNKSRRDLFFMEQSFLLLDSVDADFG